MIFTTLMADSALATQSTLSEPVVQMADHKTCPKCEMELAANAQVCTNCEHDFGKAKGEKLLLVTVGAILLGVAAIVGIGNVIESAGTPAQRLTPTEDAELERRKLAALTGDGLDAEAENAMDAVAAEIDARYGHQPPGSPWTYRSTEDKVRGGTSYFAETSSTNSVNLDFPYGGGSTVDMTVRKTPAWGLDVYFTLSSGQLICNSYRDCHATVRFDQGPAQRFNLNEPSDHSNNVVFVSADHSFLAKLKKAKKLVVELEIYEGGRPQFEFNVAGLQWEH